MAFYELEPFGESWKQSGTIAAVTANAWRDDPLQPQDFIPVPRRPPTRQEIEQQEKRMLGQLLIFAHIHNAR